MYDRRTTSSSGPMMSRQRQWPYRSRPRLVAICVGVMVFLMFTILYFSPPYYYYHHQNLNRRNNDGPAFSLLVTLQFRDVDARDEFLQIIQPMMEYIQRNEITTIGYEVLFSDKDDLQVLVLERYVDKDNAYLTIHRSSKEFQSFRPKLKLMQDDGKVVINGNSYNDSGLGFVGRNLD